jgi:pimeloyl-ACP methyl ester carboxylesterase
LLSRRFWLVALSTIVVALVCASTASAERVFTVKGASAPGPARYDRVRVIEQGPRTAHNVLVLVPGTSGGAAYFRPVAADIVKRLKGWRVWSVDRRENRLEDHSMLDRVLARKASLRDLFRYYLEWLGDPSVTPHFTPVADGDVPYARRWGMGVAIRDLHKVIAAARRGGNRVVLGGHSLGGTIAVAYATWDFDGRAGAHDLDGLVLIDGGSSGTPTLTKTNAEQQLAALQSGSPFLDLTGLGLPWSAGVFNIVGSTAARQRPNAPAVLGGWPLLPANLRPPVPATNAGGYGYALDNDTSPASLRLVHMHIGHLATSGDPRPWVDGELNPVHRAATMFSGIRGIDGSAWYHPRRLSLDGQAVAGGVKNPAQKVLGVRATHGDDVHVPIYAIETSLGAGRVLRGAKALARRSHVRRRLVLVDRHKTYDHIDPLSAVPGKNAFLHTVIPFLRRVR